MAPRLLLIAVGSRGDAEPFCSLAASLAASGAPVDLFLQKDLIHLAPPAETVKCHSLPFTQQDFYKFVGNPTNGVDHSNPRVKFVGVVADIIGQLVLPCYEQVLSTAQLVDGIVASSLARSLALLLAEQLHIPLYLVQLQPLVPTKDFPHFSQTEKCVEALTRYEASSSNENMESYIELERFQFDFGQDYMKKYMKEQTKLSDFDRHVVPLLKGESTEDIFMVNAFSEHVIPKCLDAGPKVLHVGPLADSYVPADYKAPADLEKFLQNCSEPPVCIGFGSMPFERVEMLIKAVQRANRSAVLVGRSMVVSTNEQSTVFCVPSVPYAWLLPRCSMMLSHGGAGVLHATLRAGITAVLSPFMGDQFLFAKLVTARGIGVQVADNLTNLREDDVLEAIHKAGKCKDACRAIGKAMSSVPSGAETLAAEILATCARRRG